jgi:hypothetical protein
MTRYLKWLVDEHGDRVAASILSDIIVENNYDDEKTISSLPKFKYTYCDFVLTLRESVVYEIAKLQNRQRQRHSTNPDHEAFI